MPHTLERASLYRELIDTMTSGVAAFRAVRDPDSGEIIDFEWLLANRYFESVTGRVEAEVVGERLLEVLPEHGPAGLFERYRQVVETGTPDAFVTEYHGSGVTGVYSARATKLGDGFVVSFVDVTDEVAQRKAYELLEERFAAAAETARTLEERRAEAERADHAKSRFLAVASDEIGFSLDGALAMCAALADTDLDATQRAMLNLTRQAGVEVAGLVANLRDLSRIQAGRLELAATDFHLGDLVKNCVGTFAADAAEKGVSLHLTMARGVDRRFHGDPARIRQVLENLLSNAVKFTDAGEIEVSAEVTSAKPGDEAVYELALVVEDTGAGAPADEIDGFFAPFVVDDAADARRFGGLGLGLAITKGLCELMRGDVAMHSVEGEGTTVCAHIGLTRAAGRKKT